MTPNHPLYSVIGWKTQELVWKYFLSYLYYAVLGLLSFDNLNLLSLDSSDEIGFRGYILGDPGAKSRTQEKAKWAENSQLRKEICPLVSKDEKAIV